ncbi:PREDICTED: alpha-tocopherol transfer protein-like isoform X1 [Nicrophorus vespilloides]|uniref:Alpha-tocopherol transfer protein-like isoform X1 n=2 Tax=Nicrophorus vespilloides TaxID=110193 RepID=A0ABM1M9I1_NICVS|nr:PREDICTED: alpha-tocopherol transfer protein-like isoform X1 [Nicrophorus vespilloides]
MDLDLKCKTPILSYSDDEFKQILEIRGKTLEQLPEDVNIIKEWLKMQPHLPMHPTDRQIVCFLIMNKFSIERTKEKIDANYTIKGLMPELFSKSPLHPDVQKTISLVSCGFMPKLNKKLNRVYVCRLESTDVVLLDGYNYFCSFLEMKTICDFSDSDEYIFDFSYFPMKMVTKFNPMDFKRVLTLVEKVYSNRIAGLHYVNIPSYAEAMINLIISFLKPKIRERVRIHKSLETLGEFFEKDQIPKEFGGTGISLSEICDNMNVLSKEYDEYIKESNNARVDESLRPTKLINDDFLGYHGNFKKLQVD